jgi:succinate dehydrogenase/fumarate reductase cytochrome b subunit
MRKFHRINGLILLAFIVMHFATHLSGLWGINAYNTTQDMFRTVYQNKFLEPILLIAFVAQLGVGLRLSIQGFRRKMAQKWARIQLISGLMILFFVAQHITGNLMARFLSGLDTTFYWPASVMNGAPFTLYFIPYYFIGITSLFVHIACFVRLTILRKGKRWLAGFAFWSISSFGVLMAFAIIAMLKGQFYNIELPSEWVGYLQGFIPNYVPNAPN